MKILVESEEEMKKLGVTLGKLFKPGDIVTLDGTLGVGKTCLTKGIALGLGIEENITSPTFTLISEYESDIPLYHIDVYRLDSSEDFLDLGVEDMMYGNGICVIEWAEKVKDVIPDNSIQIKISILDNGVRELIIKNPPKGLCL